MTASDRLTGALADRYRLERELGQGGMATVYLAADLKHDRQVAIKVLKPELAAVLGAERFVQEIKTTAALSHPHILPLFDSGEAGGFLYYVMPYIQGETIRQKLTRETQFGIEEAVKITTEVADALDYAHRHGVIHRDIKPENILLHDGRPMVMDFGIALAVSAAAGGRMTETGLSLGTPHYMSPEQATADKQITARSDIYSLASVLYEMLAGQPPHLGGSAQHIIMKIIAEPVPAVTTLRKSVPPHVAAALAKALEKLPADRFESAQAFAEALANPAFTIAVAAAPSGGFRAARSWQLLSAALAVTTLVALGFAIKGRRPVPETAGGRYRIQFVDGPNQDVHPIISPSGEWVGWGQGPGPVMLRRHDAPTAAAVQGTERAEWVSFSPDESALAFSSNGAVHVVALSGGVPRQLARIGSSYLAWGADGWIYFTDPDSGGIARVRATGGTTELLTRPDSLERVHLISQLFPDLGGALLFTIVEGLNRYSLAVWDHATRQVRRLGPGADPRYVAPGYLLFRGWDWSLWAVRFDPGRREMRAEPELLESGVRDMALSATGTLLYQSGAPSLGRLARIDRNGRIAFLPFESRGGYRGVRLSPDGRRLAFGVSEESGRNPIMVHDLSIGSTRELVPGWDVFDPLWSPDGKRIAFHSDQSANPDPALTTISWDGFEVAADDSTPPRRLFRSKQLISPQAWVPEGRLIVRGEAGSSTDLFLVVPGRDSATAQRLLDAPWDEGMARLSPDGRWLAYEAKPHDTAQVFVRPFPDVASRVVPVSGRNGTAPVWSADGRTLYYLEAVSDTGLASERMNLMAARVRTSPSFEVESRAVVIARLPYWRPCCTANYDVFPDGSGFIMALADSAVRYQTILVQDLLRRLKSAMPK